MTTHSILSMFIAASLIGCGSVPSATQEPSPPGSSPAEVEDTRSGDTAAGVGSGDFGLLVMAHGGDAAWNASVEAEVGDLRGTLPVALAFGMANPMTLRTALDELESQGVRTAAVVRLFLSGASFRQQTDWYLGMGDTPPGQFVLMGPAASDPSARAQLEHDLELVTHDHGLLDTDLVRDILVDRAAARSEVPATESVLLIAHGMGDEDRNSAVEADLDRIAEAIAQRGHARVSGVTLREDWPEARVAAEARIREFVASETRSGRRVIVLPARLSGFGPYAEVLDGLEYVAGEGILPHPTLSDWILATGTALGCRQGWVDSEGCER